MVTTHFSILAVLFGCQLLCWTPLATAFLRKSAQYKRFGQVFGSQQNRKLEFNPQPQFDQQLPPVTMATRYSNIVLECVAFGSPQASVYWLKDGVRVHQGSSPPQEDPQDNGQLQFANTRSRLYLDCLSAQDQAEFTCVADNGLAKNTQSTTLVLDNSDNFRYPNPKVSRCSGKRSRKGEPARIYLNTQTRMEYADSQVRLVCRAQGQPAPSITWYYMDKPLVAGDQFKVTEDGDLIVRDISWSNLGGYTCVAENILGTDQAETFLYPTISEDKTSL